MTPPPPPPPPDAPNNPKCRCGHVRTSHSKNGCGEIVDWKTGKECSCKIPYMQVGK